MNTDQWRCCYVLWPWVTSRCTLCFANPKLTKFYPRKKSTWTTTTYPFRFQQLPHAHHVETQLSLFPPIFLFTSFYIQTGFNPWFPSGFSISKDLYIRGAWMLGSHFRRMPLNSGAFLSGGGGRGGVGAWMHHLKSGRFLFYECIIHFRAQEMKG